MKYFSVFLFSLILLLSVGSCSSASKIILFNNSGHNITVTSIISASGTLKEFIVNKCDRLELRYLVVEQQVKIVCGNKLYIYDLKYPVEDDFINDNTMYFQFEPDGSIYVLKDDNFPVALKDMPRQPEGFPLKPISIETIN
ncbi:MAG: hypothetical protein WCR55_11590 [Lentisphaerota bacterium]